MRYNHGVDKTRYELCRALRQMPGPGQWDGLQFDLAGNVIDPGCLGGIVSQDVTYCRQVIPGGLRREAGRVMKRRWTLERDLELSASARLRDIFGQDTHCQTPFATAVFGDRLSKAEIPKIIEEIETCKGTAYREHFVALGADLRALYQDFVIFLWDCLEQRPGSVESRRRK